MTVENTKGCGKMESNMVKENFGTQKKIVGKREYGTTERE